MLFVIHCFERLVEVFDDVSSVFNADGQPDGVRADALVEKLLLVALGVRRRSRVNREGFHVGNIGKKGEELELIDEILSFPLVTIDVKGKDRAAALWIIFLVEPLLLRSPDQASPALHELPVYQKIAFYPHNVSLP